MNRMLAFFTALIAGLVLTATAADLRAAGAATAPLRVAILGDSITHDGRWVTRVESALRATPKFADAEIVNFGLGSETVSGLSEDGHAGGKFPRPCLHERLERVLDAFKPDFVLACYGMNDGIYLPPDDARMKAYQDGITRLKQAVESRKPPVWTSRIIFITPPLHNADKPSDDPDRYDAVLDAQALWLLSKRAEGWNVVDIRPNLKQAVAEAKRADPSFVYAADGVHPGDRGHRFIADSVCQQLWVILMLPGSPQIANDEAVRILKKRGDLLKLAWLTRTRHTRPGVPAGLPLDQAEAQAATLLEQYRNSMQPKTQP